MLPGYDSIYPEPNPTVIQEAAVSGVWERELASMITSRSRRLARLAHELSTEKARIQSRLDAVDRLQASISHELSEFQDAVREHMDHRDDPEVLTRNYNYTTIDVYHAERHCGWLNPARSERILLSEAERRGYSPCSSCGWQVKRQSLPGTQAIA